MLNIPATAVPLADDTTTCGRNVPELPLELWTVICGMACMYDDGSTALALRRVSRLLYAAAAPARHYNVALEGPHQVIAFEKRLAEVPVHEREVFHLFVSMPSLYDEVHELNGWEDGDESQSEDPTYVEGQEEDSMDSEYSSGSDDGDDDEDDDSDTDSMYEFSAPTSEEWCIQFGHIDGDNGADAGDAATASDYYELVNDGHICDNDEDQELRFAILRSAIDASVPKTHGTDLRDILRSRSSLPVREYAVYSALRRILTMAAPTLRVLYLQHTPTASTLIEAVFPVLPALEVLSMEKGDKPYNWLSSVSRGPEQQCPVLFPKARKVSIVGRNLEPMYAPVDFRHAAPLCNPTSERSAISLLQDFKRSWVDAVMLGAS